MNTVKLSPRLAAAAAFVRPGARFADIGTDHGLVPAYLAQNGQTAFLLASDVRSGPLASAKRTAEEYGVSDQIEFRLANGLSGMDGCALDTILIAGMGGETIISILGDAPWTEAAGVTLILQPQSKLPELSDYFVEHGFAVTDACLVRDAGRLYMIWLVSQRAGGACVTEAERYAPHILTEKQDKLLPVYLDDLIARLTKAERGMAQGGCGDSSMRETIAGLRQMRKETELWQR